MKPDTASRRHFHDELDILQQRIMEMAGLVEQAIAASTEAVLTRDVSGARLVRAADRRVDELEIEVDERVIALLALHQPMASDLRRIVTCHKLSNDLERMGDHASNIAKAVVRLEQLAPVPHLREMEEMIDATRGMVSDALVAFVSRDAQLARHVCSTDDRVDDLKRSMFRILVTHMMEDPKRISGALELLLVSQNLERIADLATNLGEDVVFLVEGRAIKHGAELPSSRSREE